MSSKSQHGISGPQGGEDANRCEAEYRAARHGTMVFLACDLNKREHAGLNHHDGIYGIWWNACTLEDHGHAGAAVKSAAAEGEAHG